MNPAVAAALIAGGVGVVGLVTNWWSTRYTTRSSRETARDQRLWEKRAAVYEDVINTALERRETQHHRQRILRYDGETERAIEKWFSEWDALDQTAFMHRMFIYASDEVLAASHKVDDMAKELAAKRRTHLELVEIMKANPSNETTAPVKEILPTVLDLQNQAITAVDSLVDTVRAELHRERQLRPWSLSRWPWSKGWVRVPGSE
jgi:hypothetical protein